MKRVLTTLLTLTMLLCMAGCGTPAPAGDDVPPLEEEPVSGVLPQFSTDPTIEETVLIDQDDVRVTATELTYTDYAAQLHLTIENNSGRNLCFHSGTMGYSCNAVNGMMIPDGYLNCDVAAGKKAVETVSLNFPTLQICGIHEIAELEIGIYTTDEDYDNTYYPPVKVATTASLEENVPDFQTAIQSKELQAALHCETRYFAADRLYDEQGVTVLSQALVYPDGEGPLLLVEVSNDTQELRTLATSQISLNDIQVESDRWSMDRVSPGKRAILALELSLVLDEAYWEPYGLEQPGSIGFALEQLDWDLRQLTKPRALRIEMGSVPELDKSGTELCAQDGVRLVGREILPAGNMGGCSVLFLVENTGSAPVALDIARDTLSVNGYMVDQYVSMQEMQPGQCAALVLELAEDDLAEIQIDDASQIEELAFTLEISRGETEVAAPEVTWTLAD